MKHIPLLLVGLSILLLTSCQLATEAPTAAETVAETEALRDLAQRGVE